MSDELWAQAQANQRAVSITVRVVGANVAGAAFVALQAIVVGQPARSTSHVPSNATTIVGIAYLVGAVVAAVLLNRRRADRTFGWIGQRRQPTPDEMAAILDFAWAQAREILRGGSVSRSSSLG